MFQLRDAMSLSILGTQPLIGLATGFDQTGSQLLQLSSDLTTIGASLETNSADIVTTAANLDELADTVNTLTESVENGPDVGISAEALDAVRIAIFAVAGWLLLFAVGCVVVGAYLSGSPAGRLPKLPELVMPGSVLAGPCVGGLRA